MLIDRPVLVHLKTGCAECVACGRHQHTGTRMMTKRAKPQHTLCGRCRLAQACSGSGLQQSVGKERGAVVKVPDTCIKS